jgi:hypothetical protein
VRNLCHQEIVSMWRGMRGLYVSPERAADLSNAEPDNETSLEITSGKHFKRLNQAMSTTISFSALLGGGIKVSTGLFSSKTKTWYKMKG